MIRCYVMNRVWWWVLFDGWCALGIHRDGEAFFKEWDRAKRTLEAAEQFDIGGES